MTNDPRDNEISNRFGADPVPPHGASFWADLDNGLQDALDHSGATVSAIRGRRQWAVAFAGVVSVAAAGMVAVSSGVFGGGLTGGGNEPASVDAGQSVALAETTSTTVGSAQSAETAPMTTMTFAPAERTTMTCILSDEIVFDGDAGSITTMAFSESPTTGVPAPPSPPIPEPRSDPGAPSTTLGPADGGRLPSIGPCDEPEADPDHAPVASMGFLDVSTLDGSGDYAVRTLGELTDECQRGSLVVMRQGGETVAIVDVFLDVELSPGPEGAMSVLERCGGEFAQLSVGSELVDGVPGVLDPASLVRLQLSESPVTITGLDWDATGDLIGQVRFDGEPGDVSVRIDVETGVVTRL